MENKPDFESMLKKNAFKIHPLDTEKAAVSIDHADWCFEHVWSTYVVPLQERLTLEKESNDLLHQAMRSAESRGVQKGREEMESENKALREEQERCLKALEQLANYNKNLLEEIDRLKSEVLKEKFPEN